MSLAWLMDYSQRQLSLLFVIGINQFLLSLILYLRSNFSALLLFKTDSFLSVLDRLIMIAICSLLLWGGLTTKPFQISWFVYAQTVAYASTALIAWLLLVPKMQFKGINWNMPFFVIIIKKSWPYALLILLMGMYSRIDTVLIERLLPENGDLQAGIYASAYRLLDVANNMSGYLFAVLLLPIFSKLIKEKKDLSQMVKLSFTLLFLLSSSVAMLSFFYGNSVMSLLYHQHSSESSLDYLLRMEEASKIFKVLMTTYIATSATYIFGTLLTANGSLRKLNQVAFAGMIISLGLNLLLIPKMEAIGSSWASFSAQIFTALLQIYFAFKILPIHFERAYYLKLLAFLLISLLLTYASSLFTLWWIWKVLLVLFGITITAFSLKLLNIKAFIKILQIEKSLEL
jgi:O-antigen/teichoic acid export membrane protein